MDCDKCQNEVTEMRCSDFDHGCEGYNHLCEDCWGALYDNYKQGKDDDYLRYEDEEMIGKCQDCDASGVSLRIWDNENKDIFGNIVDELEEEGQWDYVYTNWCRCENCYEDLEEILESEYKDMLERKKEAGELTDEDEDEDEDEDDEEPEEDFNYNWKPIMAKL